MDQVLKAAVVGAGPAGLVTAKYLLQYGFECDVFEQTEALGGNWVYKDCTDIDENGMEVHSSIYRDMLSNVPKEIMAFSDFKYSENIKESYITHNCILEYHQAFADYFNIKKFIQCYARVTKVIPIGEKWLVTVKNIKNNTETSQQYDMVFICNGRYRYPDIPKIVGQNLFCGSQIHSRNYRIPDPYKGQAVLIIGAGTSGKELVKHISKVAKHVFLSTRAPTKIIYSGNITEKTEVTEFSKKSATFTDGTTEIVDAVVYCTGYIYKCPFLTEECGVKLENNSVVPLYKQIININHPTMYFIGLPVKSVGNLTYDLQVRFVMAVLRNKFILPSKEKMLLEWVTLLETKERDHFPEEHLYHINTPDEVEMYAVDLAFTANIEKIPSVVFKVYRRIIEHKQENYVYKIIDDEIFEEIDT